jgi:hypothetical protein
VVCNNSKTERKGGRQGGTADGLLTKICQNGVVSEVHKDSEDISAGIGIFEIKYISILSKIYVKVGEINFDLAQYN